MDGKNFGRLIKELRRTYMFTDPNKRILSRKDLAERTYISVSRLGRIESGKALPRPEELVRIADELRLTRQERVEFFSLASGVSTEETYKCISQEEGSHKQTLPTPEEEMQRIVQQLNHIRLPLFVTDPYSDIVAANDIVRRLYGFPLNVMRNPQKYGLYPNTVFLLFSEKLQLGERSRNNEQWVRTLISNIQFFRRASMEVRTTPYWRRLSNVLYSNLGKVFTIYWIEATIRENIDANIGRMYRLTLPTCTDLKEMYGENVQLDYQAVTAEEATCYQRLYITIYTPQDERTAQYFESLAALSQKRGYDHIHFHVYSPWTIKRKNEALIGRGNFRYYTL